MDKEKKSYQLLPLLSLLAEFNRPGACMKGLFTRARQPKMAGHLMRSRYWSLAHKLNNVTVPEGVGRLTYSYN